VILDDLAAQFAPGQRWRRRRILLAVGVVAPIFAFLAVILAVLAYPGFNNATQFLSDLGGATAKHPWLFNGGVFISGFGAAAAGIGFGLALVALGGNRVAAGGVMVCFVLAGFGMAASALIPWPNPWHLLINLGLGIILAPLFMIWGLWKIADMGRLKLFLAGISLANLMMALITNHRIWYGLVNPSNVGLWETAFAILLVGWTGIAAYALERRLYRLAQETAPEAAF
jgi:glucan biosynthesis protein C